MLASTPAQRRDPRLFANASQNYIFGQLAHGERKYGVRFHTCDLESETLGQMATNRKKKQEYIIRFGKFSTKM